MKRDPNRIPLNLNRQPRGGWRYVQKETGYNIQGERGMNASDSFYRHALRLSRHRLGNNLPKATFDECQQDILLATRAALKMDTDERLVHMSDQAQFREIKKRRCSACGKKREAKLASKTQNL